MLGPQYAFTYNKKVLEANIVELKHILSDQNLELIPDYEQRIEVLKELKFIDDNSTVLLKGRVACEVSSSVTSTFVLMHQVIWLACPRSTLRTSSS